MTVQIDSERKAVVVTWDTEAVTGGTVDLRATNPEDQDVSTRDGLDNDGNATVTFPADYSGSCHITITDEDGNTDEGNITV